ncbi:MAG: hypothetical protein M3O30_07490 [Planctomycetota bacterium]|nr:hypothetical protein [Planctomycetota bacterium]
MMKWRRIQLPFPRPGKPILAATAIGMGAGLAALGWGQATAQKPVPPATPVAVVTVPFYYAEATAFDHVVGQLVLGVADHAQQGGDGMTSQDRKYLSLSVGQPMPTVETLQTFSHARSYLGWVGCPRPQLVVKENPQKNSDLLPTLATSPHEIGSAAASPLERSGMVFIAPAR